MTYLNLGFPASMSLDAWLSSDIGLASMRGVIFCSTAKSSISLILGIPPIADPPRVTPVKIRLKTRNEEEERERKGQTPNPMRECKGHKRERERERLGFLYSLGTA